MNRINVWIEKHPVAALTAFLFAVLSIGTAGVEITKIDIRFALMTAEMAEYGVGLFPTMNGHPYADYPSLYNFLAFLTSCGGRGLNAWTLALPTILLSCYIVAMTAKIGERLQPGSGMCAALFTAFSYEYMCIFSDFSIDIPVAAATVTAIHFMLKYDFGWRSLPMFAAMLMLSFAVRGPLGFILCGAAAAGFVLGCRRWKALPAFALTGVVCAAVCLPGAYWAIHRQGGEELWRDVVSWQVSSRMESGKPFYYYFTNALVSFLPVTFFTVAALVMKRRELLTPRWAAPLLWMLLPMVLLSVPGCKHLRYLSPALPAFALIAAAGYVNADDSFFAKLVNGALKLTDVLCLPLGMVLITAAAVTSFFLPCNRLEVALHLAAALALLLLCHFKLRKFTGKPWPLIRSSLGLIVLTGILITCADATWENSGIFVRRAAGLTRGKIYIYRLDPDHDALKVMFHLTKEERARTVTLTPRAGNPKSLINRMYPTSVVAKVLPTLRPSDVVITRDKRLKHLKNDAKAAGRDVVILTRGRLGHREAVAVKLVPLPAQRHP